MYLGSKKLIDQQIHFCYNTSMKNIFAKTQPIELVSNTANLHNWRFIGMEMEALGTRLDAARRALSRAQTDWARWYWTETLERLLLQWRHLPALRDGEALTTLIPRWNIDYEYYENYREIGYTGLEGLTDALFEKIFCHDNLDDSWNRIRDEKIMKCRCH
jgi:hypothetical protein